VPDSVVEGLPVLQCYNQFLQRYFTKHCPLGKHIARCVKDLAQNQRTIELDCAVEKQLMRAILWAIISAAFLFFQMTAMKDKLCEEPPVLPESTLGLHLTSFKALAVPTIAGMPQEWKPATPKPAPVPLTEPRKRQSPPDLGNPQLGKV
jgi:hypothetical protein